MAPIMVVEGDPAIEIPDGGSTQDLSSTAFELSHRHPTRLSDIGGVEETENISLSGSWHTVSDSSEDKADTSGYKVVEETIRPSPQDYHEFYRAVAHGDIDILKAKLELGVNVDKKSSIGYTALVIAIKEMQVETVKFLLETGADVHHHVMGTHPLVYATSSPQRGPELLRLLIDHGANLNMVLHCAAIAGTIETVEFLVSKGMDLEATCRRGCTPLITTARVGRTDVAKALLRLGAKLDAVSENGASPLIWSSALEKVDAVKFWLELGVDIDARDNHGRTSLFLACHYGGLETANVLLENGADHSITSTNPANISALMAAAESDRAEIVKALAAHGCDLHYKNNLGATALDIAITKRRPNALRALLEAMGGEAHPKESASLKIALSDGHASVKSLMSAIMFPYITERLHFGERGWVEWVLNEGGDLVRPRTTSKMMHVALEEQNIGMVTNLLEEGCGIGGFDINARLESGHTPLSFAVGHRNLELIELLLNFGADPNVPRAGINGYTPFDDAIIGMEHGGDTLVVDLLLKTGRCRINRGKNLANTTFSYVLGKVNEWPEGRWETLAIRMLDSIPDVNNDKCDVGCSLLHVATVRESEDFVGLLLIKGADLEAKNELGVTPLLLACQHSPKMIPILIERGANLNATTKAGAGVLAAAASYGNVKSLEQLIINYECNIEADTGLGYTPLACALEREQEEAALYLINRGANVHWKIQPSDQTALQIAAELDLESVVEELLKKGVDVNTKDKEGRTPLHEACVLASPEIVRMLLDAGADIEAELPNKDRPLHVALINEQELSAELLIERGADITARTSKNRTPLHICAEFDLAYTGCFLLTKGVSTEDIDDETWTPLCCCGDNLAEILIDFGANVNYANKDNWTPLHRAVSSMDNYMVEILLKAGADVDVRTTDDGLNVMERAEDIPHKEYSEVAVRSLMRCLWAREVVQQADVKTEGEVVDGGDGDDDVSGDLK